MEGKLIFLDIDGTLTEPGTNIPPESAIDAMVKARQNGHKLFICTGRNYDMLSPLLKYGFDGVIGSAGGYVSYNDDVIFDCPMEDEQRIKVLEVLEKNCVFRTIECYDGSYCDQGLDKLLKEGNEGNSELLRWRKQIEESLNIKPISEYKGQPIYKIVFMCNDLKQLDEPRALLEKDFQFVIQEMNKNGIINGELINRRFDKGQAVERICKYLGCSIEDTIGIGDSMNDYEMISTVGISICMENGCEDLKNIADYVCPAVTNDGIKNAFEKFGII